MSYDLNILVLNQKNPSKIPFESSINVLNEVHDYSGKRYHSIWPFMTRGNGIWYSLVKDLDGLSYASFCDSDFEADEKDLPIPYWITDSSIIYNLTPLIVEQEYRSEFEKIVLFLLRESPIRTIMLLARYQGGDEEIICGMLSVKDFMGILDQGKILFNVCYIIKE